MTIYKTPNLAAERTDGSHVLAAVFTAAVRRLGAVMPFKSQAQRRKFAELLLKGKISNETFEEWNRETGSAKLPERVKPKANTNRRPRAGPSGRPRPR
jgi:hypothetical protein